jgi:hypothetical protein
VDRDTPVSRTPIGLTCISLQLSSLSPSELSHLVRYSRSKELTDDEEETSSSPKRHKSSPVAEEGRPSREETIAEEPVVAVHRGVRGSGGHIRGLGKRVISRHPSLALRGHLETVPKHTATIKLPSVILCIGGGKLLAKNLQRQNHLLQLFH